MNDEESCNAFVVLFSEGEPVFLIVYTEDENEVRRKVKYIDADSVFSGKIVRDGTKTYIVGQRRPL